MHAVIDIQEPSAPLARPDREAPTAREVASAAAPSNAQPSFGRDLAVYFPTAVLIVFVLGTVIIAGRTDTLFAAAGFAAYLAFWLGAGFGFLAAGIRWGLRVEAADHSAHRSL